jgi:hypothetical protein
MSSSKRWLFALAAAPALLAFALALRPIDNWDIGFILRIGERVATSGIPVTDPFSFPGIGKPWALEQWLGPLVFWEAFRFGGIAGVIVFKALVCGAAVLVTFFAARAASGSDLPACFGALLCAVAGASRFNAQPNVLTTLFVAVVALALHARRGIWLLPLLFALWVHVHPGYLSGLVLLGAWAGGALLQRQPQYILLFALCAAACGASLWLFHPLGLAPLLRVAEIFRSPTSQANISEYAPLGFSYAVSAPVLALLVAPPLCWAFAKLRGGALPPLAVAATWVAFGAGELRVGRLLAEASVVLAPVFAQAAARAAPFVKMRLRPALLACLALLAAAVSAVAHLAVAEERELVWPSVFYPRACYEWLDANAPQRGFNDLWFGGSFIFHFDGRRLTFIDGRSFYSDDFFTNDYLPLRNAQPGWERLVAKWSLDYFLLKPGRFRGLHQALQHSGWRAGYEDPDCVIYLRR